MDNNSHHSGDINGGAKRRSEETLDGVLRRMLASILFPDSTSPPLMQRIKDSFLDNGPLLKDATRNTSRKVMSWTRRGSPLRALLVISFVVTMVVLLCLTIHVSIIIPATPIPSAFAWILFLNVGTITLLTLTGLLVFALFFVAATVNAIIVSLLISLAAAGGFLALFFVCLTAIFIGAVSVAVFVISTATISAVVAVLIATGWVGFFWTAWLVTKKGVGVAKYSVNMTGSAISAYTNSRNVQRHEPNKVSSD